MPRFLAIHHAPGVSQAEPPGREAAAWYCATCGALVHAEELEGVPRQAAAWRAVQAFNADRARRTCGCGAVHDPVDLGDIAWPEVAAALIAEGED